jgi:uncharacterized protein YndB with AHSA1/START domain
MASIVESIEIDRSPEDVFAYLEDLSRHGEWQPAIVGVEVHTPGPTRVGTRATEVRRIGGREQQMTYEVTEHEPPRRFAFRGLDGPIRPVGKGTIEPVGDGTRSRLSLELELTGNGLGKLLLPLAVRSARKEVPANQKLLKERLESGRA